MYLLHHSGKRRYNIKLWKLFIDCFNCLPVAALIDDRILCMHGGLSPELESIEQIKKIEKPTDVPDTGKFWSIQDFYAIFCGQILTKTPRAGEKMKEESHLHLDRTSCKCFAKSKILTWSAELIKLLRKAMNFLQKGSLLQCSQLPTIADNSTTPEHWWV